ncbi:glycosyltransferase family 9 protein [Nitrospira lenta]|uniref:Putative Glycosyltransferase, family 9 n=1 Tax=Nitrospira lenta TaxID=1436998 RepID=A0A330L5P4_9BACT|nr:glycosyltransferase family 9 protein [Nitrospira lenta]SPP65155.1 putative Glycosyltransferase, family 9 [Nitrospira lenta]
MSRTLVIQLARLGDLVQTMPMIMALRKLSPRDTIDLLCPEPLRDLGTLIPGLDRVVGWDGARWHRWAAQATQGLRPNQREEIEQELRALCPHTYDRAFVLNQHTRAIVAGTLLAKECVGPLAHGPLSEQLTPWAAYVREIARTRRSNRIHLSDAFCGMCGLLPPGTPPRCLTPLLSPSRNLEPIGQGGGPWIGVIVGAGDPARQIPIEVWRTWIVRFLAVLPRGRVVLIGHGAECDRARDIQHAMPPSILGRIWDLTGQTTIHALAQVLARCQYVVGSDTGPLHLAAAVGTPTLGWYFARARVHETGPYGSGHRIWQAQSEDGGAVVPATWPIEPSLDVLLNTSPRAQSQWSHWTSQIDEWGTYYSEAGQSSAPPREREALWHELSPAMPV